MRENQELLRARIVEAKAVGEKANTSRSTITYLKNSIEAIRRERSVQCLLLDASYVLICISQGIAGRGFWQQRRGCC
jgi:hypothetical protein